jgi:hypothetical protein
LTGPCRPRIRKHGNLAHRGDELQQDFLPLPIEFAGENADTCGVAARFGQGAHQAGTNHVVREAEYGNGSRGLLSSPNCGIAAALKDINRAQHES